MRSRCTPAVVLRRDPLAMITMLVASLTVITATLAVAPAANAVTCTSTAAGQLARWPGDNSTTEVAHGRDGTLVGDTTYATGEVNEAFSLDGNGDAVTVPDNPDWTLGGDFTVDVWVEFTAITGDVVHVADQGYGLQPKWLLWWYQGDINFLINTYAEGVNAVSVPWTPDVNVWHHLAVTRAGTSSSCTWTASRSERGLPTSRSWTRPHP